MRFTVLSDNQGCGELEGEWGLSILIEYRGKRILLDAGASDLFYRNAGLLGSDLSSIDFAVLSHAHYDHANGLVPLLRAFPDVRVWVRESCAPDCYKMSDGMEYIGVPEELARFEDRLIRCGGLCTPTEGVWLVPHAMPDREEIGRRENMFILRDGTFVPDDFSHEQSLVFETSEGLGVFSSCSHAGAAEIVEEVRAAIPGRPVRAMIGGFHLYNKQEPEIRAFASKMGQAGVRTVVTGHCTGETACRILKEEWGDRLSFFHAGLSMELPD